MALWGIWHRYHEYQPQLLAMEMPYWRIGMLEKPMPNSEVMQGVLHAPPWRVH